MDEKKRKRLEARGGKVGNVKEFLDLTPDDMREIDERLAKRNAPEGASGPARDATGSTK